MSGRTGGSGRGGGGRDGRGGRGRGGDRRYRKKKNQKPSFKGAKAGLEEHIFDCGDPEHAAVYERTLKAIVNHIQASGDRESTTVARSLENMALETIPRPARPAQIADPNNANQMIDDEAEILIWHGELKLIPARERDLNHGLQQAFGIIWGQSTPTVKSKIEQLINYDALNTAKNPVELLEEIRNVICGRETFKHPVFTMVQMARLVCLYRQDRNQSNEDYKECFESLWDAFEQQGGCLTHHPGLIADRALLIGRDEGRNVPNDADRALARTEIAAKVKAGFMLSGADDGRFDELKKHLENKFTIKKDDGYPDDTVELLSMMNNYRPSSQKKWQPPRVNRDDGEDGVNFAQGGEEGREEEQEQGQPGVNMMQRRADGSAERGAGRPRRGKKKAKAAQSNADPAKEKAKRDNEASPEAEKPPTCIHCGGAHEVAECPDLTDEQLGQILLQLDAIEAEKRAEDDGLIEGGSLVQDRETAGVRTAGLCKKYLYLDTCTTDDQMADATYLTKIHRVKNPLNLHCNAGTSRTSEKGYLGSTLFWLDRQGIANVVSLRTLEARFKVTYDSTRRGGAFVCHTPDGEIVFDRCPKTGFPYIDLDDHGSDNAVMLVQTVRKNFEGYTRREIEKAIEARRLQARTGHPSEDALVAEENG